MSIEASNWAWAQQCPSTISKLVLLCLANRANGSADCWPSLATIAAECGIARKNMPRYVKQLAEAGLISVERRKLKGALSNLYVIPMRGCPHREDGGVLTQRTGCPHGDGRVSSHRGQGVSSQGGPNLKEEPKRTKNPPIVPPRGDIAGEFQQWWKAYPHKVGKADAAKKFEIARRTADFAELMAGIERYVAKRRADQPWCNPSTWLHQQRWLDEPAVVAPKGQLPLVNGLSTATGDQWRRRLADYRKSKFWQDTWGFKPDDPDCYAPAALLSEFGFRGDGL